MLIVFDDIKADNKTNKNSKMILLVLFWSGLLLAMLNLKNSKLLKKDK